MVSMTTIGNAITALLVDSRCGMGDGAGNGGINGACRGCLRLRLPLISIASLRYCNRARGP